VKSIAEDAALPTWTLKFDKLGVLTPAADITALESAHLTMLMMFATHTCITADRFTDYVTKHGLQRHFRPDPNDKHPPSDSGDHGGDSRN
jgi:hypothetical protein